MEESTFKVSASVMNQVMNYLARQPWHEVEKMIVALKESVAQNQMPPASEAPEVAKPEIKD